MTVQFDRNKVTNKNQQRITRGIFYCRISSELQNRQQYYTLNSL
jgi:hypothetical protein